MLPNCVKTEVWRELMESLSSKINAPVVCNQAIFGQLSFFQELRNRKSDDPYYPTPGIRYVSVDVEGNNVYVGPFRTSETHTFDEELANARDGLPEWRDHYADLISICVSQAAIAGKSAHITTDSLSRAKLLLEFSQEMTNINDIDRALYASLQFIVRKFKLSNMFVSAYGKHARYFDLSKAGKAVEDRVIAHVKGNKSLFAIKNVTSDVLLDGIKERNTLPKCVAGFPLVKNREFIGCAITYAEHLPPIENINEVLYELINVVSRLSKYEKVQESATTDPLTGLSNRAELSAKIDKILSDLSKKSQPITVCMIDVDNFKNFNDTKGHPEGDRVLKVVADVIKTVTPKEALCCRYGGEEFTIVLPNYTQQEAKEVAEKIRSSVEQACELTISLGLMTCMNSSASWKVLVSEADRAMYRAKHLGKNKVVAFLMVDKNMGIIDA